MALVRLSGAVAAVRGWQARGLAGVLAQLDGELPELVPAGAGDLVPPDTQTVRWAAVEELYK